MLAESGWIFNWLIAPKIQLVLSDEPIHSKFGPHQSALDLRDWQAQLLLHLGWVSQIPTFQGCDNTLFAVTRISIVFRQQRGDVQIGGLRTLEVQKLIHFDVWLEIARGGAIFQIRVRKFCSFEGGPKHYHYQLVINISAHNQFSADYLCSQLWRMIGLKEKLPGEVWENT